MAIDGVNFRCRKDIHTFPPSTQIVLTGKALLQRHCILWGGAGEAVPAGRRHVIIGSDYTSH